VGFEVDEREEHFTAYFAEMANRIERMRLERQMRGVLQVGVRSLHSASRWWLRTSSTGMSHEASVVAMPTAPRMEETDLMLCSSPFIFRADTMREKLRPFRIGYSKTVLSVMRWRVVDSYSTSEYVRGHTHDLIEAVLAAVNNHPDAPSC